MSARTIILYPPCWVRVDIWGWYELTYISGTSWHGYELTWVRVDIDCVVIDVNSYHHLILALLGTSWHHLWYELTSLVVRVDICWWYELTWVRVDMITSWPLFISETHEGIFLYCTRTPSIYIGVQMCLFWPLNDLFFYLCLSPKIALFTSILLTSGEPCQIIRPLL